MKLVGEMKLLARLAQLPVLLLALSSTLLPRARAGLLFALVDPVVNETAASFVALVSPPNATLTPQAVLSPPRNLAGAENLVALGAGRSLYTLVANFSTSKMDLLGLDLESGAVLSQVPTPLPCHLARDLQLPAPAPPYHPAWHPAWRRRDRPGHPQPRGFPSRRHAGWPEVAAMALARLSARAARPRPAPRALRSAIS